MNDKKKLNGDEFKDFWQDNLTGRQKITRLEKAFRVLKKVGDDQVNILSKYEKSSTEKHVGFIYFINTVKDVWEKANFAIDLGKGKNKKYAFYPVRSAMENLFRLEYYINKKRDGQNEIAEREVMRIAKLEYDMDMANGEDGEEMRKYYETVAVDSKYPKIENKEAKLDIFPNMWELMQNSRMQNAKRFYYFYQTLCELTHSKLLAGIITKANEQDEYRRSITYLLLICRELIKITDCHIQNPTKDTVKSAIEQSELIIKQEI
ncbi:MAG: hypothetical protein KAR57_06235 [Bacteroidales bacterium]|nr:hypothetical protein [Bacteroidales bacterium]